jgi:hypothetical protein
MWDGQWVTIYRSIVQEDSSNVPATGYCGYVALWDVQRRQKGKPHRITLTEEEYKEEFGGWLLTMQEWFDSGTEGWRGLQRVRDHFEKDTTGILPRHLWFDREWLYGRRLNLKVHFWGGAGGQATLVATALNGVMQRVDKLSGEQLQAVCAHDYSVVYEDMHFYTVQHGHMTRMAVTDAFRTAVTVIATGEWEERSRRRGGGRAAGPGQW